MTTIYSDAQRLAPGAVLSLFTLDTSKVGGGVSYFTQTKKGLTNSPVVFQGNVYTPYDIEFEGLEVSGQGALPTPLVRISNTNLLIQSLINTYGNILGCEIRRIRTFAKFLDGEPAADPDAFFGPDIFLIERRSAENKVFIEWELSTSIDQHGKMLPGRQVIRNTCLWRYRRWTGASFDYSAVKCPYTGTDYFDRNDEPTTAGNDRCSRTLSGCEARFGAENPLPFGGFPGVGRVRG